MPVFEKVELEWKGKTYTIPPRRVLEAIARIEDHVTMEQLSSIAERPRLAQLSRAYAAALEVAGARVNADEVYEALFTGDDRIAPAILGLLVMMLPPAARKKIEGPPEGDQGNAITPAALH